MMKQTRLLVLVIISGVLLSACALGGTSKPSSTTEEVKKEDNGAFAGSMMDLLKAGKPVKCEYGFEVEGISQKGVVYTSGGKMRMDLEGVMEVEEGKEQETTTHMIVDGVWQYLWTDQAKGMGTKIKMDQAAVEKSPEQDETVDWNKQMSYKCGGWMADESSFTPPTDVSFREIDMVKINQQTQDSKASVCKMCEQLSGEAKTQCLSACK